VQEHRSMTHRQHEAVAVWPVRMFRVIAQEIFPQGVADRRQRHGCAGMTRVGLLHGIHRQGANGVDGQLVAFAVFFDGTGVAFAGNDHQEIPGHDQDLHLHRLVVVLAVDLGCDCHSRFHALPGAQDHPAVDAADAARFGIGGADQLS
nr:hypothetical protein [Tanacetum cinerariifolium]